MPIESQKNSSDLSKDKFYIDFDVSKSIRYHAYMRSRWERLDKITSVITIIFGTSIFVSLLSSNEILSKIFSVVVVLSSTLEVVFNPSKKFRDYDDLYRDFSVLRQKITRNLNPSEQDIADWKAERFGIEAREPTAINRLERKCYTEECKARGCNEKVE